MDTIVQKYSFQTAARSLFSNTRRPNKATFFYICIHLQLRFQGESRIWSLKEDCKASVKSVQGLLLQSMAFTAKVPFGLKNFKFAHA